jgi:polar amino acid transport system substrate-binding protein
MLSRRAILVSAILLTARSVAVAEGRQPSLSPDIERIVARGRLIVATVGFDLPPFVWSGADGALVGDDIELAKRLAAALGVDAAFERAADVEAIFDRLGRGEADLAVGRLSVTLDRARRVRFSRPYLAIRQALLLNRPRLASLARGRDPVEAINAPEATVAIVAGGAYAQYARQTLPRARLVAYPRWQPDIVEAVLRGDVLAGYGDEHDVESALKARPDAPLQLRSLVLGDERDAIAVALPWSSLQLLSWVDLYLETVVLPRAQNTLPALQDRPSPPKGPADQ